MSKTVIKFLLLALLVYIAFYVMFSEGKTAGQQNRTFDHSQCQYPNRNTNPPNGCDNSDPACPETIKLGYDCQPPAEVSTLEEIPTSQNIVMVGK